MRGGAVAHSCPFDSHGVQGSVPGVVPTVQFCKTGWWGIFFSRMHAKMFQSHFKRISSNALGIVGLEMARVDSMEHCF